MILDNSQTKSIQKAEKNMAGYTTLGAPKHLYKRKCYGPTEGRTGRLMDPRRTDPTLFFPSLDVLIFWRFQPRMFVRMFLIQVCKIMP